MERESSSARDPGRRAEPCRRSRVVRRCQNKFCFGVAWGEVSLDHAFHISAWLGVAPRPRCTNGCALKLDGVLMAADSEPSAAKLKPPELAMRSTLAALLGMKARGDMVGCDSVPPNIVIKPQCMHGILHD